MEFATKCRFLLLGRPAPRRGVHSIHQSGQERLPHLVASLAVFGALLAQAGWAQTVTASFPAGTQPVTVAVNPITNKTYVANFVSGTVTVIDGATNTTNSVAVGTKPISLGVNPVTNKIYVGSFDGGVTVLDGATNSTTTLEVGQVNQPNNMAVNPVTNTIYVIDDINNGVAAINGATNHATFIATGYAPQAIAVNPVTNRIYVINDGNVTVIDGSTNSTYEIMVGSAWSSVVVNPVTNKIYVGSGSANSNTVTVIDGATDRTTTVNMGTAPSSQGPITLAVNPVTNKIYFTGESLDYVTVIDGATNSTATLAAGVAPVSITVNPATNKIYVANAGNFNPVVNSSVTVIDGATNSTSTVMLDGGGFEFIAMNPVTNKAYIAGYVTNTVAVIDCATYSTAAVTAGGLATFAAVNPVTNKIYVTDSSSGEVTVIDGATNTTTNVPAGALPVAAAVDAVTSQIYVANEDSNDVTVIDGATNNTTTVAVGQTPTQVVVNPVTDKIYVANRTSNNVTVIDGPTNSTTTVAVGSNPVALDVDAATNQIYVANAGSSNVTVIDGATNNTINVAVGQNPQAVAVDPVTNQIYVANAGSSSVTVIDGASNNTTNVAVGQNPQSVAVNPVTNEIYVANAGSGNVTVIDGATNNTANVAAGASASSVTVNPVTNKIYVLNGQADTTTVIDGATKSTTTVSAGAAVAYAAVNPVTNTVYLVSPSQSGNSTVTAVTEAPSQPIPLTTAITPLTNNQTDNPVPGFTFTAASTTVTQPNAVFYQLDTWQNAWTAATGSNPTFIGSQATLLHGFHILYAYAVDGQEATSSQIYSVLVGGIKAYGFVVAPGGTAPATINTSVGTTPQSATVTTAFPNALEVMVKDGSNNPVSGVNVVFTAPSTGASGTFSNGTNTITMATNSSGIATAPFTADATAGGPYTVMAAAGSLSTSFSLTNLAGPAATISTNPGTTPQSAPVNTAFANAPAVTVKDALSNPVSGVNVVFTAPSTGASGTFSNSINTITVATNSSGIATAPFTANATIGGSYTVTAVAGSLSTYFLLLNNLGGANAISTNTGTTPQSAAVSTAFPNALAITLTDVSNFPISGVNVVFTAPSTGASGTFSNGRNTITVATNSSGIAAVPFAANATAGGPYTVTAAVGPFSASFSLTNLAGTATTISTNAGTTPQSTAVSTAFQNALAVTLKDSSNNPVSGVNVVFTAPSTGASGVFGNSINTITVATNSSGIATALFTANASAGGPYTVTAVAGSLSTSFSLTNLAGTAATINTNMGTTPQSTAVSTAFPNALAVTLKDSSNNPVSGVNVVFTAPSTGASGTFSNSMNTITVATNSSGIATAPFTANATAGGPYTVTAVAGSLSTSFSLMNLAGTATTISTNTGTTPQSTAVSTAFPNALAVTLKDSSNNPVSGVNVVFTAPSTGASGVFGNSINTITVATNSSGIATAPFTANASAGGPYTVTAVAGSLSTSFSLTNLAGTATTISSNTGTTPQSTAVSTAFPNSLTVTLKDSSNNPVSGVNVMFTAPSTGASGTFSNSMNTITVATNSSGIATAPFTANATAGGPYTVTAVAGSLSTSFSLMNLAGTATTISTNTGTTPQSTAVSTAFPNALAVTLKDSSNNPVSGVNVVFTAPSTGASGVFGNSINTITVATNSSGIATAPFTANASAGGPYTVTAVAGSLSTSFSLTNLAGTATTISSNTGTTPQSTAVSTAFPNSLTVTLKDSSNNPVSGVNVMFTAPSTGASGTFSNSMNTITVATNSSGIATTPFSANAIAGGSYIVTAVAGSLSTSFSLTNDFLTQTINFGTIPTQTVGIPLTLTASATSLLPVSYSSSPQTVCNVSGSTVMFSIPGSCSITASQAGNASYSAAQNVTQTFNVMQNVPALSNIQAVSVGGNSEVISWTTALPSTSQVNYGPTPAYGSSSPEDTALVTSHSVTLSNLAANTTYNFDVVSINSTAGTLTSTNATFTTTPSLGYLAFWGVNNSGVTISWSTDVPANTVVAYGTTMALGQLSTLQPALTNNHGVLLTGLNSGTTYFFQALSTTAGGSTGGSTIYSFTTTGVPASPAPVLSNVVVSGVNATSVTVTWTTDQASTSQLTYGTTTSYGTSSPVNFSSLVTSHSVTLTGLTPGTTYDFEAVSMNSTGTATGTSNNYTFTTTAIPIAPVISNIQTSVTSNSATITWTTDQASNSAVNYGTTANYGSAMPPDSSYVTSHSVTINGLSAGTTYDFDVVSANTAALSSTSPNGTFVTTSANATPPYVGYVAFWGVNNSGATISWSTDVLATTQLAYGTSPTLGQLTPLQTALTASHGVVLTGLNPGTTYYFVAQSTGSNGATGYSTTYSFTTSGAPSTPAPIITSVNVQNIGNDGATITWTTDEGASSQVNYGVTMNYTASSTLDPTLTTSHSVTLTNLSPGTTYDFDVMSANSSNTSATSPNSTFQTTGSSPGPAISAVVASIVTSGTAIISWTTDQASSSQVNYGPTTAYGQSSTPNAALVTSHSVMLSGLTPNTIYDFAVVSANGSSVSSASGNYTFTTATNSAAPPVVSYVAFWGLTSSGVTISWSTNVPANTSVAYGTTMNALGQTSPVQTALTESHGVTLTGLLPSTTYYFLAQSADVNGNTGYSTTYTFTTIGGAPTISGVTVTPAANNTATISWTTSEPAYSYVQYGAAAGSYGRYSAQTSLTTTPQFTLPYVPSGTVHYQLVSTAANGNQAVSPDATFVEP